MGVSVVLIFSLIATFSLAILWREGLLRSTHNLAAASFFLALAMLIRIFSLDHETLDYVNFLSRWVEYFRQNGGFAALSGEVGNYNLPYLYFLAFFSYLKTPDLYLIKVLSIFFDVILAWGVMKTVAHFKSGGTRKLVAFFSTLLLPTVFLNGAYWGQCDSIYVAFAVWSIYFALSDRPKLSVIFIAISFAFKLQAIFVMPVFFILLFTNRVKFSHLLLFPATYFVIIAPAVLLGRPFIETLTLYISQADSIGSGLNYNSPSVYALFSVSENIGMWASMGIAIAFLYIFVIYAWLWFRKNRVSDEVLLTVTLIFCIAVPFFLPHMHDRYFFSADIFALIFALVFPRKLPIPLLVSFGSLLGYHAYLREAYLLPMGYGAVAMIFVLFMVLIELAQSINVRQQYKD